MNYWTHDQLWAFLDNCPEYNTFEKEWYASVGCGHDAFATFARQWITEYLSKQSGGDSSSASDKGLPAPTPMYSIDNGRTWTAVPTIAGPGGVVFVRTQFPDPSAERDSKALAARPTPSVEQPRQSTAPLHWSQRVTPVLNAWGR